MCNKNSAYYVQSLKNFDNEIREVANLVCNLGPEKSKPIVDLLAAFGFTFEISANGITINKPKVRSVWGVRAYSKKLITRKDVVDVIEQYDDINNWAEEEIDDVVGILMDGKNYGKHVHQKKEDIITAIRVYCGDFNWGLEDLEERENDDDDNENDDVDANEGDEHDKKAFLGFAITIR